MGGGKTLSEHQKPELARIVPHPRTLRKAREQVKYMVIDGVSLRRIRNYLHRWITWWVRTVESWQYRELLQWFADVCREAMVVPIATALLHQHIRHAISESAPSSAFDMNLQTAIFA